MVRLKTTLDIPDDLFREAKAKAALEGSKLKDFVAEALRLKLGHISNEKGPFLKFPLLKSKGKVPLKIPDDVAFRLEMADESQSDEPSL